MKPMYFPDAVSGWLFFALVMSILAVASWTDQRARVVPKWLTLPALGLGVLASVLRGCWLAAHILPVWAFEPGGVVLGGLDGLLFALAGFGTGFGLIVVMWMLGVCGGGDVKLLAALGAWIGPTLVFWALTTSLVLLSLYLMVYLVVQLLRGRNPATELGGRRKEPRAGKAPRPKRVLVKYSVVVAAATALVLLWAFRADLHLVDRAPPAPVAEVHTHAR